MTIKLILQDLRKKGLKLSRETLYCDLRALRITPLGVRQSPQNYPDDVPARVMARRGFPTDVHQPQRRR